MNKLLNISLLFLFVLLLSSCSFEEEGSEVFNFNPFRSRVEMLNQSTDEELANARLEQVIETIKNKDKDALRELFSKNAMEKADDFDECSDSLFGFIQGEIISWEQSNGRSVYSSNQRGKKQKQINSFYFVKTDEESYYFLMKDFPIDKQNVNNAGLYLLLVAKADERLKIYDHTQKVLFDGDTNLDRCGVYLPFQ